MPNFTAGTSFTDGVTNDVTAAKLNALIADAVPTSSLSLNSTTGTISQFSSGTGTAASPAIQPTGDTNTGIFFPAADTIAFSEGGTESMRIDSSGNVGIGTTSPSSKLHISGGDDIVRLVATDPYLSFYNGSTRTGYIRVNNTSKNFSIVSEDATTPLTIYTNSNERLRIDSSGNVLVNTTSNDTGAKLEVKQAASGTGFGVQAQGNDNPKIQLRLASGSTGVGGEITSNGGLVLSTSNTERLRITSNGNLLIGTTTDIANIKLSISDGVIGSCYGYKLSGVEYAGTLTNHAFAILTNNLERLRIASDGLILFAKNTTSLTTVGYRYDTNGESYISHAASTNAGITNAVYSTGALAYRFYVGLAGTIFATNTTISAISDARLKENIRDINAGLDSIMALKPRLFDWKEGKGANVKNVRGFIAQEIEQVFPDLVDEWKDPAPEGEEPYKSVRQDLIPVLVKAIQEQQAMIVELQSKVAALEAA